MDVDTDSLPYEGWITVQSLACDEPKCPTCGVQKAYWDCMGCGYEWTA